MVLDYSFNNQLYIDKATYLATIIGQITVYGILLTFYQFVVSFQGTLHSPKEYMGISLTEYYVKKKVWIYKWIVSNPFFLVFLYYKYYISRFIIYMGVFGRRNLFQ